MELELSDQIDLHTRQRLENIKRKSSGGAEFWLARELGPELGYPVWGAFEPVVKRAATSMARNGVDAATHIVQMKKEVTAKNNARIEVRDYFLSRGACYLIAMNGDPAKPEIAAAQAYFAIQTRRMEQQDDTSETESEDVKRLKLRGKVSVSFKRVSGVANQAGVGRGRQGLFHEQRFRGLYDMGRAAVYERKGLKPTEELLDRIGVLELSAHEFQMNLAANALEKEEIKGEQAAIRKNLEVAQEVRRAWTNSGATLPEDLPQAEHISHVRKRVTGKKTKSPATLPDCPNASSQPSLLFPSDAQET